MIKLKCHPGHHAGGKQEKTFALPFALIIFNYGRNMI
jgi:hypothetical protein